MPHKKTAFDYKASIIKKYAELQADPTNETLQNQLNYLAGKLEENTKKTIIRANNEGNPWEETELKMTIRSMPTKAESGKYQTADYICYYEVAGHSGYCGLLVERKGGDKKKGGPQDIYGTLMVQENCARFYREIERFKKDKRFNQMVVIAECSYEQFLLYSPPFIGKERNSEHIGASAEARRGKIASLYARGVPVVFAGTRYNAIETYKALVRQWIIKNYDTILGLNTVPYNDEAFLKERLARLEVEIQATKAALGVPV